MRSLVIAAVAAIMLGSTAHAAEFDVSKAAKMFNEAHSLCKNGGTDWAPGTTAEQSDRACATRETLAILLQTHGQCWDKSEQEWAACDAVPVPTSAPSDRPTNDETEAIRFVRNVLARHSGDQNADLQPLYADTVIYFGQSLGRADVMQDKKAYFHKWPTREYRVHEPSLSAICAGAICDVIGTYGWSLKSSSGRSRNGISNFRFKVGPTSGWLVQLEDGGVIDR